jgi:hypothetical protein
LLALYLFSLGLGGVLLAASLFADADSNHDVGHHGGDADWNHLLSIRNITYFLFVFGGVGALMTWLQKGAGIGTLLIAAATALGVAAMVDGVFRYLRRTDSPAMLSDVSLVGRSARVTLPVGYSGVGKVELMHGGQRVELLARPFGDSAETSEAMATGSEVLIVEMSGGTALVSRALSE